MTKEEQILSNWIVKSSKENSGEIIHKYLKKKTKDFSDLSSLSSLFSIIVNESLFVGCREFIRLQDIAYNKDINNSNPLLDNLDMIAGQVIDPVVNHYFDTLNVKRNAEGILAAYAIGNKDICRHFLEIVKSPSLSILTVQDFFLHDADLSARLYDIIVFLLDISKHLDDYYSHDCIRALKLNQESVKGLLEYRREDICRLSKWYYDNNMFGSLGGLMNMLEIQSSNENQYKKQVFEFVGINKDQFLKEAFERKTAKSLELFFVVKYDNMFPEIEEINKILACNNSQSILCIVMQCLKRIKVNGALSDEVKQVLYRIKEGIKKDELKYNVLDEYEDRGMRIGKLDSRIIECFQALCRNEQDVKEFIALVSYFNVFGNGELRLDFDMSRYLGVKHSDWEKEYNYICGRYCHPRDISYVVMNSYLKLFVDVFDFAPRCGEKLNMLWFTGYIQNSGRLRLIQDSNNPKFNSTPYYVIRSGLQADVKDSPEERQYVRFKITKVEPERRTVYVGTVQTIAAQMRIIISNAVYALLLRGKIHTTYCYLKGFEQTERNLLRRDRFTSVGKTYKEDAGLIEKLIFDNRVIYRTELQYIYLNSFLRTFIPLNKVAYLFDEDCYLLADIYYDDNKNFDHSDYYYIRPNYYVEEKLVLAVDKSIISPELEVFIAKQLNWREKENERISEHKNVKTIRVCFKAQWGKISPYDVGFVTQMYLHCCESMIKDFPYAISVYYARVQRIFRKGISRIVLTKYIEEHKSHLQQISIECNDEFSKFIHLYFKYLSAEIQKIIENDRAISRWIYKDVDYNTSNMFVVLDDILFDDSYYNNEYFISFVKNNSLYRKVMEGLKSCPVMRKCVYEKTIVKYLFNNYEDYENAINQIAISAG